MADRRGRGAALTGVVLAAVLAGGGLSACSSSRPPAGPNGSSPGPTTSAASASDNGIASMPPDQALANTKAAAKSASWVHVTGSQNGTTLDLRVGKGQATGTLSETGVSAQILATGGHTYLKGDKAFWDDSLGTDSGQKLAGKWVLADAVAGDSLSAFTDIGRLFDNVLTPEGPVTLGTKTTLDGQAVVGLVDGQDGQTLYVATTGQPYPLTIRTKGSTEAPPTFDAWNQAVTITAPPKSQVLDPATLDL